MSKIPMIGYGATYTSDEEAYIQTMLALEAGYRIINTCLAYGNLKGMGNAISRSGIMRDELLIVALDSNERRSSQDAACFNGYEASMNQIFDTLNDLGIPYLDFYLINWPVPRYMEHVWPKLNADSWRAMEVCVSKGLIQKIGVSNFLKPHLDELEKTAHIPISMNQLEIHPSFQQRALVEYCQKKNMELHAWSPLFKGKSVALPVIVKLAEKYHKTPAQIILKWDVQHGITPMVSSENPKHIRQNFEIFDFQISEEDMKAIDMLENGEHFENYSYVRQQKSIMEQMN